MHVGENIRKLRRKKGLTQAELANKMGVSQQMVNQYENGKLNPKLETAKKIASALEVPVLELLSFSLADVPTSELLAEIERRCK